MVDPERKKLVSERLKMVVRLIEHNETLATIWGIEHVGENGWTHFISGHEALVHYLLLTCFDVLGQSNEWKDFGSWLRAGNKRTERDAALATLPPGSDPVASALHLQSEYNKIYGVKQSFNRFIDSLAQPQRDELFYSIGGGAADATERDKRTFLFMVRNAFTHKAVAKGNAGRAISPYLVMLKATGGFLYGYQMLGQFDGVVYMVRRWPFLLIEIVAGAIGEPIPDIKMAIRINYDPEPGKSYTFEAPSSSVLYDPDALRESLHFPR